MLKRILNNHEEGHYVSRANWLRAAVLGANDGIISVSSLVIGIAVTSASTKQILLTGVAGLVSGAMSMAAGEYVSVSSQSDLEKADLIRESAELKQSPDLELQELADIYIERGASPELALKISKQMMDKDALGIHAKEELGISEITAANPLQASIASAASFSFGAAFPVIAIIIFPREIFITYSSLLCILLLGFLGALAGHISGSSMLKSSLRIMFWGGAAIAITALIGSFFGVQTNL